METSNNWKFNIKIKHLFTSKTTPEVIIIICTSLIQQLKSLIESIEKSNIVEDDKYYLTSNLEEIKDGFQFLQELADGSIPENEWDDYCFEGDFESEFNGNLTTLYDLADCKIESKSGDDTIQEKFLWID
jgi:hypothetical protein